MLKITRKIAIYSGEIPSTTFIERLILGLVKEGNEILLFGNFKKKINYPNKVKVIAYRSTRWSKAYKLLYYSFLLTVFKIKEKRELDIILKQTKNNRLLDKVKCYPVLWHKPDIFHVQWAKSIAYWQWVQKFNINLVLSLRGAHINYSPIANKTLREMYNKGFPKVDAFHAVSIAIAKEAEKYGASIEKTKVIYSGLNLKEFPFKPKEFQSKFKIISVGRSHWKKGYHYALDACNILKHKNFNFEYTIVGVDKDIELLYQIEDLQLGNYVTLLANQPIDTVKKLIHEADVLLLPSVEEGVANVVLEAMALGTLVLTTDCGGMIEVVKDKLNGFVCPIRDPKVMAQKLIEISQLEYNQQKEITKLARKTIENNHTLQGMIEEMNVLYTNVFS